ncbi:MAG: NAD(P)H-binding protein [Crocinitomicaceae bacterium]|nr:NAD(P)H-binding protein [Crocinitomicaceae bacterium]
MQTILGSGGAIGKELAKALTQFTTDIRLVSRNPKKINETDQLVSADLMDPENVKNAIKGSTIVYVTVGFPYNTKIWQENWPKFISSVIDGCIEHNAKLVFFDNIYMYDPAYLNGMTEETPFKPVSKKGKVREQIVKMILDKVEEGKLTALIARSADFYGPGIKNTSMLTETVFNPLSKGKKATWPISLDHKHSYTYTPDAGKATAILGNTDDAFNQTWHLPTASNPMNGREWVAKIAQEMGAKNKASTINNFMFKVIGLFVPVMKEMPEMMYQYDREYDFNSDKFMNRFPDFKVTPYETGVKAIVAADYKK